MSGLEEARRSIRAEECRSVWKFLASHWPGPAMERGYEEAHQCLISLQSRGVLLEESASSRHLVLDMMTHYMSRLRLDLTALPPVVHVAGTKGKGSTCAFVESILRGHGLRTGPHAAVAATHRLFLTSPRQASLLRHTWCTSGSVSAWAVPPSTRRRFSATFGVAGTCWRRRRCRRRSGRLRARPPSLCPLPPPRGGLGFPG